MANIFTFSTASGKVFQQSEKISNAKLNQLGVPTITCTNVDDALVPTVTGQVLVWNQATGKWGAGSIGAAYLPTMQGATATVAGVKGAVPAPSAGDQAKFLRGDGTYGNPPSNVDPLASTYAYLNFN